MEKRDRQQLLEYQEKAGELSELEIRPSYTCKVNDCHVATIVADFSYNHQTRGQTVEFVGASKSGENIIKFRLLEALFNLKVELIRR